MSKRTIYLVVILSFILCIAIAVSAQPELDISFNGTGHVTSDFGSGVAHIYDVVVQPDNKVVGIGTWNTPNFSSYFVLTRYNEDGTLDTSFGQFGRVVTDFDPNVPGESATAGAIQPDGKIIAAGYVSVQPPGLTYITVARYNTNGSLDLTFGDGGKVFYALVQHINEARAVAVGPDGSIAVAGEYFTGTAFQTVVVKLSSTGAVQASGTDVRSNALNDQNIPTSVAFQQDGKIVTSGVYAPSSGFGGGITFARYNTDGTKDVTFGSGGRLLLSNGSNQTIYDIKIQADGRIVGAGLSGLDFMVMRMWGNGMLDISFSDDGRATASFPTSGAAVALHVKPNGKIIAAGAVAANFAVAAFNADGSLDTSFSGDGTLRFGFPGFSSSGAESVAIDSLGRIVLGGSAGSKFAAARLYTLEPAPVSVSGQTITPGGQPIRGITVGLTNQAGETRWAITSNFGYYQFDDVPTGQTYTLFVRGAKRHTFETRDFGLNDAVDNLDLIGVPRDTAAREK